jgi:glutamate formiminotransferase
VRVFECVPNVSEGRDEALLAACAAAIEGAGARLAHRTSDAIHHRSVFTFFGEREPVLAAALALARVACAGIDLRAHRGAHPRIGALDVLPFIPFGAATPADAVDLAREAAERIWAELRVPSFLYGAAANRPSRELLADVRAGGFEGLAARTDPYDAGDAPHPAAGAIAIGARAPLVAFNVVLAGANLALARTIARRLRERGGGLRTLRCIGVALGEGRVQVACNLTDPAATPLHRVLGLIEALARSHGASVERSELIGLAPRAALEAVTAAALGIEVMERGAQNPA